MPSDLQVSNIKDQANANSAITIASDGQITVNQNNPTITLGSNATFGSTVSLTNVIFPTLLKLGASHEVEVRTVGLVNGAETTITPSNQQAGRVLFIYCSAHINIFNASYGVTMTNLLGGLNGDVTNVDSGTKVRIHKSTNSYNYDVKNAFGSNKTVYIMELTFD